jgi:hypothetical protein
MFSQRSSQPTINPHLLFNGHHISLFTLSHGYLQCLSGRERSSSSHESADWIWELTCASLQTAFHLQSARGSKSALTVSTTVLTPRQLAGQLKSWEALTYRLSLTCAQRSAIDSVIIFKREGSSCLLHLHNRQSTLCTQLL